MHRFFAPDLAFDRDVELPPDEAHHVARVMRLKSGASVAVFDGRGNEAVARIESIAGNRVVVKPLERRPSAPEPAVALTLAQALLKSDGMDRVVRDAVMMGVVAIQPFLSARTEVPSAAVRSGARRGRWDRTVIASVKQCGRSVVPVVHTPSTLREVIDGVRATFALMFVEPGYGGPEALTPLESLEARVPAKATIFVGPEGGWDPQEIRDASSAGVLLVTAGRRTLRADAAGAAAIAVLQYVWRDL